MKQIIKTSLWVILAVLFLIAGGEKLWHPDAHAEEFAHWGYPLWFLYVTGIIEVGSAVGLLIPAVRLYAVIMLSITMVGASITHLRAGEMNAFPVPIVLLLLLILLAWTMRSSKTSSSIGP